MRRTPVGLRLIPHPAVTLALMFGTGSITVVDATGRQQRGSLVAGLGFGSVRVQRVENFECLQVRERSAGRTSANSRLPWLGRPQASTADGPQSRSDCCLSRGFGGPAVVIVIRALDVR